MGMLATVRITDPAERRQGSRRIVESGSTLRADSHAVDVVVFDLSETGCAIKAPLALAIGNEISIGLVGYGTFEAKVVRKNGDTVGCEFFQPIDSHVVSGAFASTTVIAASGLANAPAADVAFPEPELERWSTGYRTLAIVGSSVLLWGLIGTAIVAL